MNRRKAVLALVGLGATSLPFFALGQQPKKMWRVGYFSAGFRGTAANEEAFLAELKARGYEVGRNLILDMRYAEWEAARYPGLADELIALRPDVLLVTSTGNALVVKRKTATIPIVLGSVGDPVGDGLVQSLARPGGNITGNALQILELGAKQIELMTEVLPRMRRVAVLTDLSQLAFARVRYERIASAAAAAKGLSLELHRVDGSESVRQAFRKLTTKRADALLINPSPLLNVLRPEICRSAADIRLPSVGFSNEWRRTARYSVSVRAGRRQPAALHILWIEYSKARNRPSCRWNSPRSSTWWSMRGPRKRLASGFRNRFSSAPTG